MINVDVDGARKFITDEEFNIGKEKAKEGLKSVKEGTGKGSEWLGWRRILKSPNDAELDRIEQHAQKIREDADLFIVCGIGGRTRVQKRLLKR